MKKITKMLHGGDYNPDQWLDQPDILKQDIELMKAAHTNAFSVGIFAWAALEPEEGVFTFDWLDKILDDIHAIGGVVALATPSGARPAWLSKKYPEVLRTTAKREKNLHGARHNHCFTSPVYREKVNIINTKLAERYKDHPAVFLWHVSNEYGGECHCDLCQNAFREWLQKKYTTLDALNKTWWGAFWSHTYTAWDQIESPSPLGETMVHAHNLDWKRFVTDQTLDFYKAEIEPLRRITPSIPVTTNFMGDQPDMTPFNGLDYSKFAEHVDIITWDSYPQWHNDVETTAELAMKVGFINDLYRSMKQQPFLILECTPSLVNWQPVNKAKRPGMHFLSSMQNIAHGSDSIMYFQWRKSKGSSEKFHGAVVDHNSGTNNRVFKEVAYVGIALEKLTEVVGSMPKSDVAFLYDWESKWALEDAQAFSNPTKKYHQTSQQMYKYFWNKNISTDVITKDQDFNRYKLLVVPMQYMMSESLINKLKTFVEQGGTLVSTYISGMVDENDLVYEGAWHPTLQELFGINIAETDVYYPGDSNVISFKDKYYSVTDYAAVIESIESPNEYLTLRNLMGLPWESKIMESTGSLEILARYNKQFYVSTPAITKNSFGKGQAYYIGARLGDDFNQDFFEDVCNNLNIKPVADIQCPLGVSVQVRSSDQNDFVFIMNFTEKTQMIIIGFEATDMLTGQPVIAKGKYILNEYGVKILKKNKDKK